MCKLPLGMDFLPEDNSHDKITITAIEINSSYPVADYFLFNLTRKMV